MTPDGEVMDASWPRVRLLLPSTPPHQAGRAAAAEAWDAFCTFTTAAGYVDDGENFVSFLPGVGQDVDRIEVLRCALRTNAEGRLLLTPHPAWEMFLVADAREHAYLEDYAQRACRLPPVMYGDPVGEEYFCGPGPLLSIAAAPAADTDVATEAAQRSRGEMMSARRGGHGALWNATRQGIDVSGVKVPLPVAFQARSPSPRLLQFPWPPSVHHQLRLIARHPRHPIQGVIFLMMSLAIVSQTLQEYEEKWRLFEPSPAFAQLRQRFGWEHLAQGDAAVLAALVRYEADAARVPWPVARARLRYHHDPSRAAPVAVRPGVEGTIADAARHYVRVQRSDDGLVLAEPDLAGRLPPGVWVSYAPWGSPGASAFVPDAAPRESWEDRRAGVAYGRRKRRREADAQGTSSSGYPVASAAPVSPPPARVAAVVPPRGSAASPGAWYASDAARPAMATPGLLPATAASAGAPLVGGVPEAELWLSGAWAAPGPLDSAAWRGASIAARSASLFGRDGAVNWADMTDPMYADALLTFVRGGPPAGGGAPPKAPERRAMRFHAAVRRPLREWGRAAYASGRKPPE